jgi:GDPmannose 4,6-dehydratase
MEKPNTESKRALITGVAGQDGTILSQALIKDGYSVTGLIKPGTGADTLLRYAPEVRIFEVELSDQDHVEKTVVDLNPHEIYNFGGISSIVESVNNPEMTHGVNVGSAQAIVRGMTTLQGKSYTPKLVAAASGTIFEGVDKAPQTEDTVPEPKSPYAQSKAEVISLLKSARETQSLFTTAAILYNHESPLRGEGFVTRKITMAVAKISLGQQEVLELGDIEVARDWGWAPDYVNCMRLMLGASIPSNFILATGISHRLSFFVQRAFAAVGITNWQDYVVSTSDNLRKVDTNLLVGDSRKAYIELGWRHTVDFDRIAAKMVQYDLELLKDPDSLWHDHVA